MSELNYKSAGVDIDAGNEAVDRIKDKVKSTFSPDVLAGLGSFGSLFSIKNISNDYDDPVLVQSIDGEKVDLTLFFIRFTASFPASISTPADL